jgi:hypothetical protein
MKLKFFIQPYSKTGILIPFRYKGNWYYSNASGSIFRYDGKSGGSSICSYVRMEIQDNELVGVAFAKPKK